MSRERAELKRWRGEVRKRKVAAKEARKTVASAKALFSKGKLVEAEQVLQKLLGRDATARRVAAPSPPRAQGTLASSRFAEIKQTFDGSFKNYEEGRRILREFLAKYPDGLEAEEARSLLAKMGGDLAKAAEADFAETGRRAEQLAGWHRADEARRMLEAFRKRSADGEWYKAGGEAKIESALAKVEEVRVGAAKAALERARTDVGAGRFKQARRMLGPRGKWPSEVRDAAEAVLSEIVALEAKAEKLRDRHVKWSAFVLALHRAGKKGVRGASEVAARDGGAMRELGFGDKLARMDALIREAKLVDELAEMGLRASKGVLRLAWKGRTVAGRAAGVQGGVLKLKPSVGDVIEIPLGDIPPKELLRLSGLAKADKDNRLRIAAYLALRGEFEAARERLADAADKKARALAADIDEFARAIVPPKVTSAAPPAPVKGRAPVTPSGAVAVGGLVAHWRFDEGSGTTARDSSGKGHNGRIVGAKWAKGKLSGALEFDGIDDCVTVPYSRSFGFGEGIDFTIAAWVKLHRLGRYHGIVSHGPPSRGWLLYYSTGWGPTLEYGRRVNVKPLRSAVAVPNEWYHIAAVLDRDGNGQMYVNGQPSGHPVALDGSSLDTKTEVVIGKCTGKRVYLDGAVDDVRIYDRALSGAEVEALFEGRAADEATQARPPAPEKVGARLPGGPKEPLPGSTGRAGEWAPGLVCEIFKGRGYRERVGVRVDPSLIWDFGNVFPDLSGEPGRFELRWKGHFLAPVTGRYSFNRPEGFKRFEIDGKKAFGAAGGLELAKGLHRLEATVRGSPGASKTWLQFTTPAGNNRDLQEFLYHEVPELGSMGPFAEVVQGLKVEYFKDDSCRRLVSTGTIEGLDFDLQDRAACTLCGKDGFSMRASGYLLVPEETEYTFKVEKHGDDGVQVYVHGKLVVDMWEGNAGEDTGRLKLSAGFSRLKVRFRDTKGAARLKLLWQRPRRGMDPIHPHSFFMDAPRHRVVKRTGLAPGVTGFLYRGTRPAGRPVAERVDSSLHIDWSGKRPAPNMADGDFSAVWQGFLMAPEPGHYVFRLEHDGGGVQFSVGGRRTLNRLASTKGDAYSSGVRLPRGATMLDLRFVHKKSNKAFVKVSWLGPNFHLRPVAGKDLAHKGKFTVVAPLVEPPAPRPVPGRPKIPGAEPVEPLPKGNLVKNGDFEKSGTAPEVAQGWTKHRWGSAQGAYSVRHDRVNSHGGDRSLLVRTLTEGVHPGARTTLTSVLVPGKYELRFWACAAVGESADVCAHLAGRDVMSATVGEDWKQFKKTVEIRQKKVRASLRLYTTTPKVRAWFDDVEVRAFAGP
ncbi:MAG: PA14 domain-containing protein [Planctomycetota bacterium]